MANFTQMEDLPEELKSALREFRNSVFWNPYKEYVMTKAAQCLGQIRTSREDDTFTKGEMTGIEKLYLDLLRDSVENGSVETANKENIEYTKKLLEKDMEPKS